MFPKDTGRKLNVYKTFRRRPERLLSVLCTFNLRLVSTGLECVFDKVEDLQPYNFIKKRLQQRYFPVKITKFLRTRTLRNICECLVLTERQ